MIYASFFDLGPLNLFLSKVTIAIVHQNIHAKFFSIKNKEILANLNDFVEFPCYLVKRLHLIDNCSLALAFQRYDQVSLSDTSTWE